MASGGGDSGNDTDDIIGDGLDHSGTGDGLDDDDDCMQGRGGHQPNQKWECESCHKTFDRKSNLEEHVRTHTGDKPFKCDVCDKAFAASANLGHHKVVHSREKPKKCTWPGCAKAFGRTFELKRHFEMHSRKEAKLQANGKKQSSAAVVVDRSAASGSAASVSPVGQVAELLSSLGKRPRFLWLVSDALHAADSHQHETDAQDTQALVKFMQTHQKDAKYKTTD